MAYNGSGTFLINTAGQPVVPNTVISATAFNALTNDLANGLSTCITKDGQTTPTANIPMGSNKITGLAPGTSGTDAANLSQVQGSTAKLLQSVTGTDTITAAMVPALTSYSAGQMFYFVAAGDNTGAVTINIDSLGAKSVTRDGSTALVAGDIVSGEVALIVYDGTRFQLLNGNSFTNLNVSNNLTLSGGTANGVLYLNGSKVATSGSALTFDGTNLTVGGSATEKLSTNGALRSSGAVSTSATGSVFSYQGSSLGLVGVWGADASTIGQLQFFLTSSNGALGGEQMRLTSTGLGIGTASPAAKLHVVGDSLSNTFKLIANTTVSGSDATIFRPADNTMAFSTNGAERARIDSSGNLGLGVTPSAWGAFKPSFQVGTASLAQIANRAYLNANCFYDGSNWKYIATDFATQYLQQNGTHVWYNAASGTAGNAISFTQAMTLDANGQLSVGTTSANYRLRVASADNIGATVISRFESANQAQAVQIRFASVLGDGGDFTTGTSTNHNTIFATNNTERARITSGGILLSGKTTDDDTIRGIAINGPAGELKATNTNSTVVIVNRQTDDGVLVSLRQANAEEGSISVSGNTVSYNAFAGSHWSQLQDGSKPDILRGTVMESINELCEWPGEENERLPKSKISDTAGSKKVYGVFMAWDNDWTGTNDMYVTAVGAFICRVNGSVTVQEGDLLESNGDGTARVQADDIIRSSTIGKVTSTVKTHEYDDGSYCVPTVLYCG